MKFFRIINKFVSFLYYFIKFKNSKIAFLFAHYHLDFKTATQVERAGNLLAFIRSGNKIPIQNAYAFKQELRSLIAVLNDESVKAIPANSEDGITLKVNNILLKVFSVPNIFTVYEIYLEKLYNLSTPGSNNIIVDIGMNAGYATLFFASSEKTAHVYSYEPFPGTYNEAINNIKLNPHLKHKITTYNYGISNRSGIVEVPMLESGSATAATSDILIEQNKAFSDKVIKVEVKSIIEILTEIVSKHPNQKLFLKVDCEGEEYGIMDRLNNNTLINDVSAFFIEWHVKGPDSIITVLNNNGFTSLHIPRVGVDSGMIYAFK